MITPGGSPSLIHGNGFSDSMRNFVPKRKSVGRNLDVFFSKISALLPCESLEKLEELVIFEKSYEDMRSIEKKKRIQWNLPVN